MKKALLGVSLGISLGCGTAKDGPTEGRAETPRTMPAPTPAPTPVPPAPPATTSKDTSTMPIDVTWKIDRQSSELVVSYTVKNSGDKPILVLDEVVAGSVKGDIVLPDRVVARYDQAAKQLVLTAGMVRPQDAVPPGSGIGVARTTTPVGRAVAPGAEVTGTKKVALPLAPWHPDVSAPALAPIPADVAEAVLEVSWLPDESTPYEQHPAAAGGTVKVPGARYVREHLQTTRGPALKL